MGDTNIGINVKIDGKSAEILAEGINGNALEPVGDLVKPTATSFGKLLGDVFTIVGLPLEYQKNKLGLLYQSKLEQYKKELESKAANIPEERVVEPDLSTILQAIEDSKYCITNDDLRLLFVNLVVSSIDKETKRIAHPSFADCIKQMTSNDAKVIMSFAENSKQTFRNLEMQFNDFVPDELRLSIDNLLRLRLLQINSAINSNNLIKVNDLSKTALTRNWAGRSLDISIGTHISHYSLTEYGKKFVEVCCQE